MQVQQPPPRRRIVPPSTQTPATPAGGAFSRSGTISDGSSGFPAGHIRPSSLGVTPGSSTPGGTPIPSGSPITSVAKIVVCVILAIGTISLLSFDIIDVDAFFGTKTGGQLSKGDDDKSVDASSVKEENVVAKEKSVVRKEEIKVAAKFLSKSDRVWAAEIMEIEALIHKNEFQQAVSKCVQLSEKHAKSGYVFLLKGRALKSLAELQRSNEILKKAVSAFESAAHLGSKSDTTDATRIEGFVSAAESLAFLGKPSGLVLLDGMRLYPEEKRLARLYIVSLLRTNKNDKAEQFIREKLAANQDVAFNLVHLGYILDHKGDYEDAVRSLEKGLRMKSEGEHEDKEVHEGRMYQALGDALIRLNRKPEADNWFSFAAKKGIFISQYQRSLYNAPRPIKALPWWSINDASQPMRDGIELLEKNWLKIRDEVTRIMNQNTGAFEAETEGLQKEGDWRQFTLFQRGRKVKSACEKTPFTCELLRRIPDATSCKRGQIKFSVMKAGTHVWPHTGPTNCRIRTHLGLIIPPGPKLRVATETREWAEGKMILFDDSFEHEVWNNGNSTRLVLIVDFWHPELTLEERRTLTQI